MKLFQRLLVAPAALGLMAPLSANATEVNLNEISKRFIRKDMVCLHKSLVACLLLDKRENEITFNIGLSKHAFESHAWTSVNNIPFTDEPDYIKNKYVVHVC